MRRKVSSFIIKYNVNYRLFVKGSFPLFLFSKDLLQMYVEYCQIICFYIGWYYHELFLYYHVTLIDLFLY